jgi:pyridoxamine 5'-phosphate oxidase
VTQSQAELSGAVADFPPTADLGAAGPEFAKWSDPFWLFDQWMRGAVQSEPEDPNAMALATVDASGLPDVRMVLLKSFDERGFVFFTHALSQKGRQLEERPVAAAVLHWKSIRRQVRLRGDVEDIPGVDSDEYYASRSRNSQIGAWASKQSSVLGSRQVLEHEVDELTGQFGSLPVPRPDYWRGRRIVPRSMEFWQNGAYRLHYRLVFRRDRPAGGWKTELLYP